MAKVFSRIAKEITMAVKMGGPDPDSNPSLRRAIQNGRAANMPKDRIEAAIDRALGKDTADYEECIYEGYAPHGVQVMVVSATDNPTRTVANVRHAFSKNGGSFGASGSVSYNFQRMGVFRINRDSIQTPLEELEFELIDFGLQKLDDGKGEKGEDQVVLSVDLQDFGSMQTALEERGIEPASTLSEFVPQTLIDLTDEQVDEVLEVIDALEQDDDVQQVFHNLS